jgi:hypothetical protein
VRYSVTTYESEREEFRAMLQEEKVKLKREKEQLLTEKTVFKEALNKSCRFVPGLAHEEQELVEAQVVKLA